MVSTDLMRGDDWIRCCICFKMHKAPYEGLAKDSDGQRWDVCSGVCAAEAGLDEPGTLLVRLTPRDVDLLDLPETFWGERLGVRLRRWWDARQTRAVT